MATMIDKQVKKDITSLRSALTWLETQGDVMTTDVLTITGERTYEKEEKGRKYHRVERAYGSFARSFTLPEDAAGDKVAAEFKDGVLKVHLPKSEKAKPKSIEVKIG